MGANLSPTLCQELENMGKDADGRKSAMRELNFSVKDMDSNTIPLFLAQVSKTNDVGSSYGEHTISLYEVLARVHGPKIVSQIDDIMSSIIKTLTTSGGSFLLQQACSKVVLAIARYVIAPTTPEENKRWIVHSLCKPLSDSLLCTQENLSCAAAHCLKALVDCDNWRFASDEMVNEVCLKVAGALEDKSNQTDSYMGLVMSLAKRNSLIVEAYARLLIHAGLRILNCGPDDEMNSQKHLTSIEMVLSLMRYLDVRSIFSELEFIIEEMGKCWSESDLPYVKRTAFKALLTAKKLVADNGSKIDSDIISVSGSNFGSSGNGWRRHLSNSGDGSAFSESSESNTRDPFGKYESFLDSPSSSTQVSCNVNPMRKNMTGKLWNQENGCVDMSQKEGMLSELICEDDGSYASSDQDEDVFSRRGYANGFPGFVTRSSTNGAPRNRTPSPQGTRSHVNVDNIKIFNTPRKLVRSLQDNDENFDFTENQTRWHRSQSSIKYVQNGHLHIVSQKDDTGDIVGGCEVSLMDSESVSLTEDIAANADREVSHEAFAGGETKFRNQKFVKNSTRNTFRVILLIFLMVFVAFAVFAWELWYCNQNEGLSLVPT